MNDRQFEIDKYAVQYMNPDYRMGKSRKVHVERALQDLPRGTLLDVGTGRGETVTLANRYGHTARGTEVVPYLLKPGVIEYAEAHNLPYADESFDHVTCFDVLEHLLEKDIEPALREFLRVARRTVTVSAAVKSHVVNGVELHVSAKSREAWHKQILDAWFPYAGRDYGRAGVFSFCWRVVKT